MGKIRMKKAKNEVLTFREVFREFVNSQETKGVAKQTVKTYHTHFQSVSKHLNMDLTFGEQCIIVSSYLHFFQSSILLHASFLARLFCPTGLHSSLGQFELPV